MRPAPVLLTLSFMLRANLSLERCSPRPAPASNWAECRRQWTARPGILSPLNRYDLGSLRRAAFRSIREPGNGRLPCRANTYSYGIEPNMKGWLQLLLLRIVTARRKV